MGTGGPAAEPPAAFLHAVGRRRRQRRVRQAGVAAAVLMAVCGVWLLSQGGRGVAPAPPGARDSALALAIMNADRDPGDLKLVSYGPPAPDEEPLRVTLNCDPGRIERWFRQ
jgi:hypothetical protein